MFCFANFSNFREKKPILLQLFDEIYQLIPVKKNRISHRTEYALPFFFFSLFATEFKRLYITGTESIDRNKQTKRRTEQTRSHRAQARGREKKGERENEGDWDFVYIKGNILSYISINRNVTVRHATREKRKFMIADSFSLVGWFAYLFVCLFVAFFFLCLFFERYYICVTFEFISKTEKDFVCVRAWEVEALQRDCLSRKIYGTNRTWRTNTLKITTWRREKQQQKNVRYEKIPCDFCNEHHNN